MDDATRIAQAVGFLWRSGPELFGDDWPAVSARLRIELARLEREPDAAGALLSEIDRYPAAREELVRQLARIPAAQKGTRSFRPLPGNQAPIEGNRFVCPEPGCDHVWVRRSVGQRPAPCPLHHLPLIPSADPS